jgi:hypothetical protein
VRVAEAFSLISQVLAIIRQTPRVSRDRIVIVHSVGNAYPLDGLVCSRRANGTTGTTSSWVPSGCRMVAQDSSGPVQTAHFRRWVNGCRPKIDSSHGKVNTR